MKNKMRASLVGIAALLLTWQTTGLGNEPIKSGPQVGKIVPGPFHPLVVTGQWAGQKHCLYCENGSNPVAVIFARKLTPSLSQLIKKIDDATAKYGERQMGSFVVFLNDSEELPKELKTLANRQKITKCILSIDNPAGPEEYGIAKNAEVTVLLYEDNIVRANHSFGINELNEAAIRRIMADLPKIFPN